MGNNFLKASLSAVLLISSVSLAGCGGRVQVQNPAQIQPPTYNDPSYNDPSYNDPSYNDPSYNDPNYRDPLSVPQGVPNTASGSFAVDQDMANQWQAKGIAVSGGTIYVTAADNSGLFKKGTVIKMNATDGKKWDNIGSKWLGLRHPIDGSVGGLAVAGGSIIAVDTQGKIYTLDASKGNVKVIESAGGTDVAYAGGAVFIANGAVERTDTSGSSRSPVPGLMSSGGIGADNMGNVYVANGTMVKKADPSGQVMDLIMTDLTGATDVAVDSRPGYGDLYVLDGNMIKRFTADGQIITQFSSGASRPVGIAVDETGAVYVADSGASHKESKVYKFSPATDMNGSMGMNSGYGNGYDNYSAGQYGAYGNTGAYGSYGNTNSQYGAYNNTNQAYGAYNTPVNSYNNTNNRRAY